jgi:hypothetical protein
MGGVQFKQFGAALPSTASFLTWVDTFGVSGQTLAQVKTHYLFVGGTEEITPSLGVVNNGLKFTSTSNVAGEDIVVWVPSGLNRSVNGASQFCEIILTDLTANARGGPALWCVGDGRNTINGFTSMYLWNHIFGGLSGFQSRVNNVNTSIGAGYTTPALGTKIAVTVKAVGATNVLETFYDGVSQGTRTDAAPTVTRAGLPGLASYSVAVGPIAEFNSLRCGLLSKLGY